MPKADGKTVFDSVAELYDEFRPSYPEKLAADAIEYAQLTPDSRILEIGCGPGKATILFAGHGYRMLCVEPGPRLVEIAREKCKGFPVEFMVCSFEDCPLPEDEFGLAFAASSFHWLNHEIALPRIAKALKPRGALAIFRNKWSGGDSEVFREINELAYKVHAPEMAKASDERLPSEYLNQQQVERSGFFEDITVKTYPWSREYSSQDYVRLLETYSGHRILAQEKKKPLYEAISGIIDGHGGRVTKKYIATLFLARRKL